MLLLCRLTAPLSNCCGRSASERRLGAGGHDFSLTVCCLTRFYLQPVPALQLLVLGFGRFASCAKCVCVCVCVCVCRRATHEEGMAGVNQDGAVGWRSPIAIRHRSVLLKSEPLPCVLGILAASTGHDCSNLFACHEKLRVQTPVPKCWARYRTQNRPAEGLMPHVL